MMDDVDEEEVIAAQVSPDTQQLFLKTVDQMVDTIDLEQVEITNDLPQELDVAVGCIMDQCASSEETAVFLARDDTLWNFGRILKWGKISRLNELVLGILANMAHYESVRIYITHKSDLRDIVFYMLYVRDVPTLIELLRLIHTCITGDCLNEEKWRETVTDHITSFVDHTQFILQNCKNEQLLAQLTYLLDQLIDVDSEENVVLMHISNWKYIDAIVLATEMLFEEFENFGKICRPLHVLHTLLVDPTFVQTIPSSTNLAIMKLLYSFAIRCSTSRVLSKEMDRANDEQLWCAGQVSTACVLQIAYMLLQITKVSNEEERKKLNQYHEGIKGFAKRIIDAFGVLSAIEVYFPDGSPWSDICYRDDEDEERKEPPDTISRDLYKYAQDLHTDTHDSLVVPDTGRGRN